MKLDQALVAKITATVEKPVLVGKILQICLISDDEEKTKAIVRMYLDPDVARLRAKHIAPAIAFFVGLSEGTATMVSQAIQNELSPIRYPELENRPEDGMRTVPEFQYGCLIGFLEGVAESEGYGERAQRYLGYDVLNMMKWDKCEEIMCHECYGGISNSVSAIFKKHPYFVSEFLDGLCKCPPEWLTGAYANRISMCFLHKVVGMSELTFKQRALALKSLHDEVRFGKQEKKTAEASASS